MLSSSKTEEVSQNRLLHFQACRYNCKYLYTTLLQQLQVQIYYATFHNTKYTTLHKLHLIKLRYTNYTTTRATTTTTTTTTTPPTPTPPSPSPNTTTATTTCTATLHHATITNEIAVRYSYKYKCNQKYTTLHYTTLQ